MIAAMIAALAAATAAAAQTPLPLVNQTGGYTRCVDGREHRLQYRVTGPDATHFVDLDAADWRKRLDGITCDVDHTRLSLRFVRSSSAPRGRHPMPSTGCSLLTPANAVAEKRR